MTRADEMDALVSRILAAFRRMNEADRKELLREVEERAARWDQAEVVGQ